MSGWNSAGRLGVVGRHEHQRCQPSLAIPAGLRACFERFAQQRGDDVDHRVVGALPRVRVALVRVADDAERRLVDRDPQRRQLLGIVEQLRIVGEQVDQP